MFPPLVDVFFASGPQLHWFERLVTVAICFSSDTDFCMSVLLSGNILEGVGHGVKSYSPSLPPFFLGLLWRAMRACGWCFPLGGCVVVLLAIV